MRILLLAFVLLAAGVCRAEDAVDPVLVGEWTASVRNEHGTWQFAWSVRADGTYTTVITGPTQIPPDHGTFRAAGGKWSSVRGTGEQDQGTYSLASDGSVTLTGNAGSLLWMRTEPAPGGSGVPGGGTEAVPGGGATGQGGAPGSGFPGSSGGGAPGAGTAVPGGGPSDPQAGNPAAAGSLTSGGGDGKVTLDRLREPVRPAGGKGEFMTGLDQLAEGKFGDAEATFRRGLDADEENSDLHGALGAALVLGEKLREALAPLDRAMRLNPKNLMASRMTRLAYLMAGDQITAAKSYGHGSGQELDTLITEMGVAFGNAARSGDAGRLADIRQRLPLIGSTWAGVYRSGDASSLEVEYAQGVAFARNREYAKALPKFFHLLKGAPYDWSSMYYYALCCMECGNTLLARQLFTYALSYLPALPEAYAGRARCAGRQGDAERAKRDLASLAELDPARARELEAEVNAALQKAAAAGGDVQALATKLREEAETAEAAALIATAGSLRRAVDARRRRYDEGYQDGLRERNWALRRDPKNPDRMVDVADHLYEHRQVHATRIGGRNAPSHTFRFLPLDLKDAEATVARNLCIDALAVQPNHARAMMRKAAILLDYSPTPDWKQLYQLYFDSPDDGRLTMTGKNLTQLGELQRLCARAVEIDPGLVEAYEHLAFLSGEYASLRRYLAYKCRNPLKWTEVVDADTGAHLRWTCEPHQPSAEQLAQATQFEGEAVQQERHRDACYGRTVELARGTAREGFHAGIAARRRGDDAGAKAILEKALQAHPEDPGLWLVLLGACQALRLEAESDDATDGYFATIETTAEPRLAVAWDKIVQNAWKSAAQALDQGAGRDPSDARVAAFRGVLAEANDRTKEAVAWYRTALALEEARARLGGTTYDAQPPAGPEFRSPDDFGLSWAVRLKYARLLFFQKPADAAWLYWLNVANESRLTEWQFSDPASTCWLPNPRQEPNANPGPPMTATVLMESRRLLGQALVRSGKAEEGLQQLGASQAYEQRLPGGGTAYLQVGLDPMYLPYPGGRGGSWTNMIAAEAYLTLGRADQARGCLDQVRRVVCGRAPDPNDPLEAEYNRLAPKLGMPVTMSAGKTAPPADPAKVDPSMVGKWKGYAGDQSKGAWLIYTFSAGGDYTLEVQPVPGTKSSFVIGTFVASGGRIQMTSAQGKADEGTYQTQGTRSLTLSFGGKSYKLDRQ